jgi:outer membrane protein OmpA-like peptidoglycan-associated protein
MLFFGVGSAEPSQIGRNALAGYLKKDGGTCTMDPDPTAGWRWIVSGHTDEGSERANARLSGRRAQAVADLMIGLGVARENICVVAMGGSQPLVINNGPESQNRRVQMIFTKVKDPCPTGSVPPDTLR